MITFLGFIGFFFGSLGATYPHSATGETGRAQVGDAYAVVAYDELKGFRLGMAATRRMNIKTQTLQRGEVLLAAKDVVVWVQGKPSVFRMRDGWIERIPIDSHVQEKLKLNIPNDFLQPGDRIIVNGTSLLRVIDMELSGEQHD